MIEFELGRLSIYVFIAFMLATIAFIPILIFVFMRDRSKSRYDDLKREVHLSDIRNSYEHRIADLAQRLTATEDRWIELNNLILTGQGSQVETSKRIDPVQIPLLKEFNFSDEDAVVLDNLVFVLTPFSDAEDKTFRTIKLVCQGLGLICVRGDEQNMPGQVLHHIIGLMLKSRIVVANIGARNPNVYYELGIAHAIGKPTILVSQTIEDVPFDIQSRRVVTYNNQYTLENRIRSALKGALGLPDRPKASS